MVATHMGASNTKEYFEKWIKYLKLKKKTTKWQKFKMTATQRGIQTYKVHPNIQGGVQTYGGHSNIEGDIQTCGHPNIQEVHPNIWAHPNRHGVHQIIWGIQTDRGCPKIKGGIQTWVVSKHMWASKHRAGIQTLRQAEKCCQQCYTYGGNQTYGGVQTYR